MEEILSGLAEQHAELAALLAPLTPSEWDADSPCDGWSVADVVLHLTQTDELALASLRGDLHASIEDFIRAGGMEGVDAAADASVAGSRGVPGAEIGRGWRDSAAALRAEFASASAGDRVQWVVGRLSVRTLAATRLAECWIHTTDVAAGIGAELVPGPRLRFVARLAWRTIPYAFERAGEELHGAVGLDLVGPDGAAWQFGLDDTPATVVVGDGADLCRMAGRRLDPEFARVRADGPDAGAVLRLIRTYA